jgi:hypothetical protein
MQLESSKLLKLGNSELLLLTHCSALAVTINCVLSFFARPDTALDACVSDTNEYTLTLMLGYSR